MSRLFFHDWEFFINFFRHLNRLNVEIIDNKNEFSLFISLTKIDVRPKTIESQAFLTGSHGIEKMKQQDSSNTLIACKW